MLLLNLLVLFGLSLGTITDLKKREVPDSLNYSLIALGFVLNLALSLLYSDFSFIFYSVIGFGVGFGIGALFYYSGQWGGGDAKLVMGIGAIIGVNPFALFSSLFLFFIFSSLVVGAIYGLLWLVVLAFRHRKKFVKEYNSLSLKSNLKFFKIVIVVLLSLLIVLFLFGFRDYFMFIGFSLLFVVSFFIYARDFFKAVENVALVKKVKVNKLVEGDWLVEEFKFKEKVIKSSKTGLSGEDILFLKKKGVSEVSVREGVPFVPSFLLAFVLLLVLGNWFSLLF
jgi:Flp pilus assembly protein protease CpaA